MADLGSIGVNQELALVPIVLLSSHVPPSLTKGVSGVVKDDTDAVCARTVRLYRRADGQLISSTTSDAGTGAYSFSAPNEEVQRIVLDDDAGTLHNDLIDRVLPGP